MRPFLMEFILQSLLVLTSGVVLGVQGCWPAVQQLPWHGLCFVGP
jgi:hypothetical protein